MKREKPNYDFSKFKSQKPQGCTAKEYVEMERAEPSLRTQRREEAWSHHIKKYDELIELALDLISKEMAKGDKVERHISRFLDRRSTTKSIEKSPSDKVTLLSHFEYLIIDDNYYYLDIDCTVQTARLALKSIESGKSSIENYVNIESERSKLRDSYWRSFCNCLDVLFDYLDICIYLYDSPKHSAMPIPDNDPKYGLLKKFAKKYSCYEWQDDYGYPPIPSDIDKLTPFAFDDVFVSKSGMAISKIFLPSNPECAEHELEISRTAYRAYLENQFVFETEEEKQNEQKKRELILLGWLIGKGLKQGDKVKGYNRKSCWRELEERCPEYFKKPSGDVLSLHVIKTFFDGAVAQGICKFR